MSNDPEIFLELVEELGDPLKGYPHEHTIHVPGCARCDLGAEEVKRSKKKTKALEKVKK